MLKPELLAAQIKETSLPDMKHYRILERTENELLLSNENGCDIYTVHKKNISFSKKTSSVAFHSILQAHGFTIVQEFDTNNMIIFKDGKEMKKFKGHPANFRKYEIYLEVKFNSNPKKFLWLSGPNRITLFSLKKMELNHINAFFSNVEKYDGPAKPINVLRMRSPNVAISLCCYREDDYFLNFVSLKTKSVHNKVIWFDLKKEFKGLVSATAIDRAKNPGIMFLATKQMGAYQDTHTYIHSLQITTTNIETETSFKLPEEHNLSLVYCLKVYSSSDSIKDYLILGSNKTVAILRYFESKITMFHSFPDVCKGVIADILIVRQNLFVLPYHQGSLFQITIQKVNTTNLKGLNKALKFKQVLNKKMNEKGNYKFDIIFNDFDLERIEVPGLRI